jgi:ethanolamine utilization protein EutN
VIRARVVGKTWATIRVPGLTARKLLLVAPLDAKGRATGRLLVAADSVSCGEGQTVLVSFGSGSRNALGEPDAPLEASVVGIVAPGDDDEERP